MYYAREDLMVSGSECADGRGDIQALKQTPPEEQRVLISSIRVHPLGLRPQVLFTARYHCSD